MGRRSGWTGADYLTEKEKESIEKMLREGCTKRQLYERFYYVSRRVVDEEVARCRGEQIRPRRKWKKKINKKENKKEEQSSLALSLQEKMTKTAIRQEAETEYEGYRYRAGAGRKEAMA